MKLKAIIFDVDGTIADTEQWGHLPACNDAFTEIGLELYWDWKTFLPLLEKIQGNANRLRHVLQTQFDYDNDKIENILKEFSSVKKKIYVEKYAANVNLRKGIVEFIEKIIAKNLKLAVVTTSHEEQVHALFDNQLTSYKKHFNPILGKESGVKTGENGILYEKCLEQLKLKPEECLVIEDSQSGTKAALKANIPTVVTFNDYTKNENFEGALMVSDSLKNIDTDKLLRR
jgi:beta-phosphoglucomutase-like phosphatase (HAD superfamily)